MNIWSHLLIRSNYNQSIRLDCKIRISLHTRLLCSNSSHYPGPLVGHPRYTIAHKISHKLSCNQIKQTNMIWGKKFFHPSNCHEGKGQSNEDDALGFLGLLSLSILDQAEDFEFFFTSFYSALSFSLSLALLSLGQEGSQTEGEKQFVFFFFLTGKSLSQWQCKQMLVNRVRWTIRAI